MHLRSLERFDFDSVLFPYNHVAAAHDAYRADVEALLDAVRRAQRRGADDQVDRQRVAGRTTTEPHFSWYEPLTDAGAIDRAVRFVLANDDLFLNTSSDAAPAAGRWSPRPRASLRARPTTSWPPTRTRSASHRCSTAPSSNASEPTGFALAETGYVLGDDERRTSWPT